jgi:hypothetical protein
MNDVSARSGAGDGLEQPAVLAGRAVARQVNVRIREIADLFLAVEGTDVEIDFICECGCLTTTTPLTLAAHTALDGAPIIAEGHPLRETQPTTG